MHRNAYGQLLRWAEIAELASSRPIFRAVSNREKVTKARAGCNVVLVMVTLISQG